ncbi:prepilin-type N-terminal cleavage/methylation domain-containing protein [Sphingobium lactosutens]
MNEAAPFTAIEVMIVVAAVGILARAIYLIIRRVLWTLAP